MANRYLTFQWTLPMDLMNILQILVLHCQVRYQFKKENIYDYMQAIIKDSVLLMEITEFEVLKIVLEKIQ